MTGDSLIATKPKLDIADLLKVARVIRKLGWLEPADDMPDGYSICGYELSIQRRRVETFASRNTRLLRLLAKAIHATLAEGVTEIADNLHGNTRTRTLKKGVWGDYEKE
jgi:hypothetical protein